MIRLAEKFVNKARDPHTEGEHPRQQTRTITRAGFPEQQHHDDQQRQPFKARLIQLARVARQIVGGGENHRPRHIGNAAPQLAIDEIRQPAEQHPHRHADRNIIDHADEVQPIAPRNVSHRRRDTCQTAVERHAPVPQPQQLPRNKAVARKIGKGAGDAGFAAGIEQRITKPPADDHAQRAVEKQVIGMALRHRRAGRLEHL